MGRSDISDNTRFHSTVKSDITPSGYEGLVKINDSGLNELSLLVNGIYCAACIQKIEASLAKEQDIRNSNLNFSTQRLSVVWNGDAERANDFVKNIEALGYRVQPYDAETGKSSARCEEKFLLLCLGVAGFAMGNVMLLSVGVWSTTSETMGVATRDLMHWVSAMIALPTILFSGRPFFRSALGAMSKGHTNMDVPISLALLLAGGMSLFETFNHGEHVYFDSAVMLMFFLLIGRYLDFRARKTARSAATDLLKTFSGFANVLKNNKTQRILIRDLEEGMLVLVAAGESFPVDGVLVEGKTKVDTSLVTGETYPRDLSKGDIAYAGTLNIATPVTLKVSKPAENSLLADIVRLMEHAEQSHAAYVRLADRAAKLYTPVVHVLAAAAFFGWWLVGGLDWQPSLMIAITVLIITCPCALGLAVPVVQVLTIGKLLKKGVLIKSGDALERLAAIDTVMFDKTGTLTQGNLNLVGTYQHEDLQLAASLASHSHHPLSQALLKAYHGTLLNLENVQEIEGKGMQGRHLDITLKLGSRSWCGEQQAADTPEIELWLDKQDGTRTCFVFHDQLRLDAAEVIDKLKGYNLDLLLVSGDRKEVVSDIAEKAGFQKFYGEKTPPEKFKMMRDFQKQGRKVLMVGDGLNDAPSLTGADVSIAPSTAIDMAQNAADIVFMGDKLAPVLEVYKTARNSQRLVRQNFALAILYNVFAVPLAFCGFVTPLIAALCMSGSSLLVIANSFRIRRLS